VGAALADPDVGDGGLAGAAVMVRVSSAPARMLRAVMSASRTPTAAERFARARGRYPVAKWKERT
jgi:hypothetical protein